MNIELDVPVGQYRHLTQKELDDLDRLTGESSKTEDASVEQKPASSKTKPSNTTSKKTFGKNPENQKNFRSKRRNRES